MTVLACVLSCHLINENDDDDDDDVITCATFCDDRLRGLGVARGWFSRFPIDLRRRPYNTLALPCECDHTLALPCECVITHSHGSASKVNDMFINKNKTANIKGKKN